MFSNGFRASNHGFVVALLDGLSGSYVSVLERDWIRDETMIRPLVCSLEQTRFSSCSLYNGSSKFPVKVTKGCVYQKITISLRVWFLRFQTEGFLTLWSLPLDLICVCTIGSFRFWMVSSKFDQTFSGKRASCYSWVISGDWVHFGGIF